MKRRSKQPPISCARTKNAWQRTAAPPPTRSHCSSPRRGKARGPGRGTCRAHKRSRSPRLQRARIAEHLKQQRDAQQQAINDRLALLESTASNVHATHDALLADVRRECDRLSEQLQARSDELETEIAEREQARAEATKLKAAMDRLSREQAESEQRLQAAVSQRQAEVEAVAAITRDRDQLRAPAGRAAGRRPGALSGRGEARAAAERLAAERDELSRRLTEAEAAPAAAPSPDAGKDRADLAASYPS